MAKNYLSGGVRLPVTLAAAPKDTAAGSAGTKGAIAYVHEDQGAYVVTGDATGNDPCGMFTADAADGATTATVKLAGGPWGL